METQLDTIQGLTLPSEQSDAILSTIQMPSNSLSKNILAPIPWSATHMWKIRFKHGSDVRRHAQC